MRIIKNKSFAPVFLIIVFILSFSFSAPVFSADPVPCKGPNNPPGCYDSKDTNNPDSKDTNNPKINTHIENPLGDTVVDIPSFIEKILQFILMLGIPIVALAIIYCGFLFVTALGNSEKLKKAKSALVYTLIGAALLLGAFVIAEAIKGTVVEISNEAKK